jgi:hypothetical protein
MRKSFSCYDLIPHDQPCNIHKKMPLANQIMVEALVAGAQKRSFRHSHKEFGVSSPCKIAQPGVS